MTTQVRAQAEEGLRPAPVVAYVPLPAKARRPRWKGSPISFAVFVLGLALAVPQVILEVVRTGQLKYLWLLLAFLVGLSIALDTYLRRRGSRYYEELQRALLGTPPPSSLELELAKRWRSLHQRLRPADLRIAMRNADVSVASQPVVVVAGVPIVRFPADDRFHPVVTRIAPADGGPAWAVAATAYGAAGGLVLFSNPIWAKSLVLPGRWTIPLALGLVLVSFLWRPLLLPRWLRASPGKIEIIHGGVRKFRVARSCEIRPGTAALLMRTPSTAELVLINGEAVEEVALPVHASELHDRILRAILSTAPIPPTDPEQL